VPAGLVQLFYLVAAVLFVLALKGMSHPRTAVRGNQMGSLGMLIAIVATVVGQQVVSFPVILAGMAVGGLVGVLMATRPAMTNIPQVVALFNGFGGAASFLAVGASLQEVVEPGAAAALDLQFTVSAAVSALIGAVAFTGSVVAFGKLQGIMTERPVLLPGRHLLNALLFLASLGLGAWLVVQPAALPFWVLAAIACLLGVMLVIPIGGADIPVVISLLNAYSGLAAAAVGWALNNSMLIIAGSLVGAAGFILTALMSKAMNRSLPNIMFAGVGAKVAPAVKADEVYGGRVKSASPDEVAMLMESARRIVVVPGYGMAVAQAQYAIQDLMKILEAKGVEVEFAIHPVAGRMPGHMNVLLAEANIPYEKLREMDDINPTFRQTDVALVIGANDVVNPAARNNEPGNPIAGMPIIDVDQARSVVVVKRSLSPGFAGIPNPLFAADNTVMLFADAKQAVLDLVVALKRG